MKVIIDGYEVEIKAKKVGKNKANIKDTMHILSELEGWAWGFAGKVQQEGFDCMALAISDNASSIHKTLDIYGFFDEISQG